MFFVNLAMKINFNLKNNIIVVRFMTQKPYASLNIWKCRNRNIYIVLKKNQRIFFILNTKNRLLNNQNYKCS